MKTSTLERPKAFDKSTIAELSVSQIKRMSRHDLIGLIRALSPPFLSREMLDRIEDRNHEELERIVYLCRRCCRQQGY